MKVEFLLKQAGISPGLSTLIAAGIGGGSAFLLDELSSRTGNPPENRIEKPLLWSLIAGLPFLSYGIARHSYDKDAAGRHTIPLFKRWTMDDSTFYNQAAPQANLELDKQRRDRYYSKPDDPDMSKPMKKTSEWVDHANGIPVNLFNQTTWLDASRGRTPLEAAGFVSNTLNQTSNRVGSSFVTPGQVINTMVNAGIGYGTAWLAGKTLGALAGVSPATQQKLCEIGTWGGVLGGISNSANRY